MFFFMIVPCFTRAPGSLKNICTLGSQLGTTTSTFHLHFFSLASSFPSHTHSLYLPLHHYHPKRITTSPEKKKTYKKIQTKCLLSPSGAPVSPATINSTIYKHLTQHDRASHKGSQSQSLRNPQCLTTGFICIYV